MSERIGIGILCYGQPDEVARHVASVREHWIHSRTSSGQPQPRVWRTKRWRSARSGDIL